MPCQFNLHWEPLKEQFTQEKSSAIIKGPCTLSTKFAKTFTLTHLQLFLLLWNLTEDVWHPGSLGTDVVEHYVFLSKNYDGPHDSGTIVCRSNTIACVNKFITLLPCLRLYPYSFSKDILGFLMTTESQDLGLTFHPKERDVIYQSIYPELYIDQ